MSRVSTKGNSWEAGAFLSSQLDEAGLSPYEFRVYLHLCRRSGDESRSWASHATIAKYCMMSERKVRESLQVLASRGLIRIESHFRDDGGRTSNDYYIAGIFSNPSARNTDTPMHVVPNPSAQDADTPSAPRADKGTPVFVRHSRVSKSPLTPKGGSERADESDTLDAFTPEELRSEPLPRGESRKQQEAKKRDADEKRTEIMAAFRSARFDRPLTDPVPVGEFNRMRKAADELLECGATPEQVREATDAAMLRFSTTAQVTLGAVSGNFTALLTPEVSRAPSSRPMSGADAMRERMQAVHKKHADILRGELEELGYEGIP